MLGGGEVTLRNRLEDEDLVVRKSDIAVDPHGPKFSLGSRSRDHPKRPALLGSDQLAGLQLGPLPPDSRRSGPREPDGPERAADGWNKTSSTYSLLGSCCPRPRESIGSYWQLQRSE